MKYCVVEIIFFSSAEEKIEEEIEESVVVVHDRYI